MVSVGNIDELGRDANPFSRLPYAPFQHRADVQFPADFPDVQFLAAKLKGRRAGGDEEALELAQGVDDLFRQSVAEIVVLPIGAHVGEGQHRDGLLLLFAPSYRQRFAESLHGREPMGRALFQGFLDGGYHGAGNGRAQTFDGGHRTGHVPRQHRLQGGSAEGRGPNQHLVEHATQGVLVTPPVQVRFPCGLFWTHIGRGPQGGTHPRQPIIPRFGHRMGHAEISQDRMPLLQHDVGRLHVPMNHPFPVGIGQSVGDLPGNPNRLVHRELRLPVQSGAKGLSLHVGHHKEKEALGLAGVMKGKNMRVSEIGHRLDFPKEPLCAQGPSQLRIEHLHGDLAMMLQVLGQVDGGHPAATDLAVESITVGEGRPEAFLWVHRLSFGGRARHGPTQPATARIMMMWPRRRQGEAPAHPFARSGGRGCRCPGGPDTGSVAGNP